MYFRIVYFVTYGDSISNLIEYEHQAKRLKKDLERLFPNEKVEIIKREKVVG